MGEPEDCWEEPEPLGLAPGGEATAGSAAPTPGIVLRLPGGGTPTAVGRHRPGCVVPLSMGVRDEGVAVGGCGAWGGGGYPGNVERVASVAAIPAVEFARSTSRAEPDCQPGGGPSPRRIRSSACSSTRGSAWTSVAAPRRAGRTGPACQSGGGPSPRRIRSSIRSSTRLIA